MSALEEKPQNFPNKGKVVELFEKMMLSWMGSYIFLVAAKGLEKCDSGKGGNVAINDGVIVHSSFKADEEKEKKSSQYSFCTHLKRTAVLLWTERIILILVCIAIAAGFIVPIIIYAIDADRGDTSTLSIDVDVDSCQVLNSMSSQVCLCIYS